MSRKAVEVYYEIHGNEFDFTVEGTVTSGGSCQMGSDEPPWVDVEDLEVYHEGVPVSDEVYDFLSRTYNLADDVIEGDEYYD